ncbi:Cobyric acid synthase [invertebrate metagenome]|uniref:Cobyric acid synthase n=1 Tax=invertebrate metagenome TaxID=1711999 RepID=A0A484H6A8_9ZZZZ
MTAYEASTATVTSSCPSSPMAIMLQGTGSNVGKSLLVAGLCRLFSRRGLRVRPFKPQNMSNNAAVTVEGGEIGRAQAMQAQACRVVPSVHMNPVLLKPQGTGQAQVIVAGHVWGTSTAHDYQFLKPTLLPLILQSFQTVAAGADLVVVEGAGAAAEVNLRHGDIANMGFAEAADLPVVLVGDIDRGGVIAALVGTHVLLRPAEQVRIQGFLINKFRGDVRLFNPALTLIAARTGWRPFGIVPWFHAACHLPAEDSMGLDCRYQPAASPVDGSAGVNQEMIRIAVPRLPHISNFDDFDPLRAESDVLLSFIAPGTALPGDADIVILPGSKATLADLATLRAEGWAADITAHLRRGGLVVGLCAGYQMLGRSLRDPGGIEGPSDVADGLGLLDVETVITRPKVLRAVAAAYDLLSGEPLHGYEMHAGRTEGPDRQRPWLKVGSQAEGACSADGRVRGCYIHGLFAADGFRQAFLASLRPRRRGALAFAARVEATLDSLADHLETHVDISALLALVS